MDPYGNYSIYMIDIFGSFEATLVAYYLGVLLVLTVGMQVARGLFALSEKTAKKPLPLAQPDGGGLATDYEQTVAQVSEDKIE